jgi:hypothetical protein
VAPKAEGSTPCSQQPATSSHHQPPESNHPANSPRFILILSSHLRLFLPSGLFPLGFATKVLYNFLSSPMPVACPAHLILVDLICLMIPYAYILLFRNKCTGKVGLYKIMQTTVLNCMPMSVSSFVSICEKVRCRLTHEMQY